jgi:hypothetical protein
MNSLHPMDRAGVSEAEVERLCTALNPVGVEVDLG